MARHEFTKKTKRDALKRSGLICEAVGAFYGLPSGQRCGMSLSSGVEYDHIVLDANSKDNSLENCAACCISCHRWKTANHDTPMAAKTVRMQDKANGIRTAPATKLQGQSWPKATRPEKTSTKIMPGFRPLFAPSDQQKEQ